jgi:tetratricopeptide (TPR) repeat protein
MNDSPLHTIRTLFNLTGKQEEKFRYYTDKLSFYKNHGPVENTADCYHGIAGYYYYIGDYDKSIEYYMRAHDVYKSFDPYGYATTGAVIGYMYLLWGNLEKAQQFLESGLQDFLGMNDSSSIAYIYNNLGELSSKRHEYKQAMQYYNTEKMFWPGITAQYIAINMVSIAAAHLQMNATDNALICLTSVEKIREKDGLTLLSNHGPLEIDYYFYLYFLATGNHKQALKSLEAALQEAQSSKYLPLIMKYTNELHSYLLQRGDSLQSLRYLILFHIIQDSLNAKNTQARIASFEIEQQQQQKENEIEQLQIQKSTERNYYLIGGAFLLLVVMAVISRLLYKRKRDKEQLTTDFKKQLAQAETVALRAQMNPHFIFNCLNSINSYVIDQKHETASDYLIKFSKLIRLILDNSRSDTISLEKELETLRLYVLLESARFDNKFSCVYNIADELNTDIIMIPPMLLQPFVENAIWHGLMQKEGPGTITVEIQKQDEEYLKISILDDGIGRERAAEFKSKSATHKSHGLKVTSQRIDMMNKLNSTGAQVHIFDLKDDLGHATGTKVELIIQF